MRKEDLERSIKAIESHAEQRGEEYAYIRAKIDKIDDRLFVYNETLVRNTVTLEDHVKRTNLLQGKVEKVEKEVHDLGHKVDNITTFSGLIKFVVVDNWRLVLKLLGAVAGAALSYEIVLKEFFSKLFK